MATHRLFHIDDGVIAAMLTDVRFLQAIPCLGNIAQATERPKRSCRCKKQRNAAEQTSKVNRAKDCLISIGGSAKTALKNLLSADKVRITRKNSRGVSIKYTI